MSRYDQFGRALRVVESFPSLPYTTPDGRTITGYKFIANEAVPIYAKAPAIGSGERLLLGESHGGGDQVLEEVTRSMHSKSIGMKLLIIVLGIILIMSIMSILGTLLWNSNVILNLIINGTTVVVIGAAIAYLLGLRLSR